MFKFFTGLFYCNLHCFKPSLPMILGTYLKGLKGIKRLISIFLHYDKCSLCSYCVLATIEQGQSPY